MKPIPWHVVALGIGITFIMNILRIDAILLLQVYYGVDASELFHSIGYEMIYIVWLILFWLVYDRLYAR